MPYPLKASTEIPTDVMFREVGGEAVLLNLESERYFSLDDVATRMWLALSENASIQHALDSLLEEYQVEADALKLDLENFLQQLEARGLVVVK